MTPVPRSYMCLECGTLYPILPRGTEGRCPACLKVVAINPYTGLAQMAIDYLRGPRGSFWSNDELLRIVDTMVFALEKEATDQEHPWSGLVKRALADLGQKGEEGRASAGK